MDCRRLTKRLRGIDGMTPGGGGLQHTYIFNYTSRHQYIFFKMSNTVIISILCLIPYMGSCFIFLNFAFN